MLSETGFGAPPLPIDGEFYTLSQETMERKWAVGSTLDARWDIHKALPGGTGIVYVLHDTARNQVHAAKTYPDVLFAQSPQARQRFLREAGSWIALNAHPNIVQAQSIQEIDGRPVLFLEHAAGGDLGEWIGTPRLLGNLPAVLRLAVEFCDGMIHARANGLPVHRNIRPRNCLLTAAGSLKVSDFGFAVFRAPGPDGSLATHMAPELFEDGAPISVTADVYSFGVLLFQMLTGRLPFEGHTWEELHRLHRDEPAPLELLPPEMQPLVARCLAKVAEYRWRDFDEVREQLGILHLTLLGQPAPLPAATEPETARLLNAGAALAAAGQHAQAIALYDQALAAGDAGAHAWASRGHAFLALENLQEATECYTRAVAADPGLDAVWCNQAVIFHRIQLHPESLQCLDRAVELNPSSARTWAVRAGILDQLGRAAEAAECFERARQLQPRLADLQAGEALLLRKAGRLDDALTLAERALKVNPDSEEAWHAKAAILSDLGRHDEAAAASREIERLQPPPPPAAPPPAPAPPEPEISAAQWHNQGAELSQQGNFAEALACFDRAVAQDPAAALSWVHRGLALRKLGRKEEAVASCDRALQSNPDLALAWFTKGMLLGVEMQRFPEALASLEKAKDLGHNAQAAIDHCRARLAESQPVPTPAALRQQGRELLAQGNPAAALACFEKALESGPKAPEDLCGKSLALTALGRHQDALRAYDEAMKLAPDFAAGYYRDEARQLGAAAAAPIRDTPSGIRQRATLPPPAEPEPDADGWHKLGQTIMESGGNPADAMRYFDRALALNPNHPGAWSGKAVCLQTLGRIDESMHAYREAIRLRPGVAAPLVSLASILYNSRRYEEALAYYEQARQLGDAQAFQGAYRCRQALGQASASN